MSIRIRTIDAKPVEDIETTWEGVTRQRTAQWFLFECDGLPTAFQMTFDRGAQLAPGEYELDAKSFGVANGRLQMTRVVLKPVVAARAPAPAVPKS